MVDLKNPPGIGVRSSLIVPGCVNLLGIPKAETIYALEQVYRITRAQSPIDLRNTVPGIIHTEAGLKWFELECVSYDKEYDGKSKINYVTVFERPRLWQFLKELSEFVDLMIFTAGLEGYASPLVDRIDVENNFCLRLYRPSTISTEYREHVKDLSYITEDLCRTCKLASW